MNGILVNVRKPVEEASEQTLGIKKLEQLMAGKSALDLLAFLKSAMISIVLVNIYRISYEANYFIGNDIFRELSIHIL